MADHEREPENPSATVRVGVLDDHRSFGEALCLALSAESGFECVGVTTTVDECEKMAEAMHPDVLVIDYQLESGTGLDCAARVEELGLGIRLVMLTAYASSDLERRAAAVGIESVLTKDAPLRLILAALRPSAEPPATADFGAEPIALSRRQREVLELMGQGLDPARIADELSVSIHTARSHVKAIMKVFAAPTQLAAVTTAQRQGYLIAPKVEGPPNA